MGGARRKLLWGVVGTLGALVLGVVIFFKVTFGGVVPLPETGPLGQGKAILVKDGMVALYLVPTGSGHAIAVDAGQDPEARALKAALSQYQLTLDAFLLTHGHADHLGGCKAFPQVPIYALAEEVDLITGQAAAKSLVGKLAGKNALGLKVTHPLAHARLFEVSGTQVLPFLVPGHTAGSAAYLIHNVLYVGDSVAHAKEGGLVRGPAFFSEDHERIVSSMAAVVGVLPPVDLEFIAPAHSAPLTGSYRLLAEVK